MVQPNKTKHKEIVCILYGIDSILIAYIAPEGYFILLYVTK